MARQEGHAGLELEREEAAVSKSVQEQRSDVISRVYREWSLEQAGTVAPDSRYATSGDSQYPEGLEALSAPARAQMDLKQRTDAALTAAGLPVSW